MRLLKYSFPSAYAHPHGACTNDLHNANRLYTSRIDLNSDVVLQEKFLNDSSMKQIRKSATFRVEAKISFPSSNVFFICNAINSSSRAE